MTRPRWTPLSINRRAIAVVNRCLPLTPTPRGFHDRVGFVEACRYSSRRSAMYHEVLRRLVAKDKELTR